MKKQELLNYIRLFREKSNNDKLIIFVGAGVSCNVEGMPDWNGLVKKMAGAINYSKCKMCKNKDKDCHKTCRVKDTFTTDEYLKIPQYVFNKNRKLYKKVLTENIKNIEVDAPLANAIMDLRPAHVITTNYDKLLETCKSEQQDNYEVIIKDKDLLVANRNHYIIKMHGDILDPETIVLKEADYLEYSQKHVLIEMFVKSLLADHTIVFLGYSLNDYNIKLIISWINFIRMQNDTLDSKTKFGYIVLDDSKITRIQEKYFEGNNIGVINLCNMPLIKEIPSDLTNDIGKRLYSFLKVIRDASLERYLGQTLSYNEAVATMKNYRYVDYKNIYELLYLGYCDFNGYELQIFSEENYKEIVEFLESSTENAQYLKQIMVNAGILSLIIRLPNGRFERYLLNGYQNDIFDNPFYQLYLRNDYCALNTMIDNGTKDEMFDRCFYKTLVKHYSEEIFGWYDEIKFEQLSKEEKVCYLFNIEILEYQKNYRFGDRKVAKYINGITDYQEREMFRIYQGITEGNSDKLLAMQKSLKKLKEQYGNSNHTFVACNSLQELFEIRKIAIEQYMFYFKNTLFFKGFLDLYKILEIYIEAIICTNGQFVEVESSIWKRDSKKERYAIDAIDFDIMTKYISTKDFYNLIQKYKVEKFRVDVQFVNFAIECFENIANSIRKLHAYQSEYGAPRILMNCSLFLTRVSLDKIQKEKVENVICVLLRDEIFVKGFLSQFFQDNTISIKVLDELLKNIDVKHNFEIVKNIISIPEFMEYYMTANKYKLRSILSSFMVGSKMEEIQLELNDFILSFDEKERIGVIRIFKKYITNSDMKKQYGNFLSEWFDRLGTDDIIDFVLDNWLDISEEHADKLLNDTIQICQRQKTSGIRIYPDPLKAKLELICILYITDKIHNLEKLRGVADESVHIQFLLDSENFDYGKVDFSNYMWENIARHSKFMDKFIAHKEEIIPSIQKKIKLGAATDFENKILYGFLLNQSQIL